MPHALGPTWEAVERYSQSGLPIIPIRPDESKRPAIPSWKEFQSRLPGPEERSKWWANEAGNGIALICGCPGSQCEAIDFDAVRSFNDWRDLITRSEPGKALFKRLAVTRTPGPGIQVIYRSEERVPGNQRLARRPKEGGGWEVLIETRGAGGYTIVPPTPAECHPNHRPYEMIKGDLAALPVLTGTERRLLIETAASLNEYVEDRPAWTPAVSSATTSAGDPDDISPGADYNRKGDWHALLMRHGWVLAHTRGEHEYWRRPGKEEGVSATLHVVAPGILYVFSSNAAPLEADKSYDLFGAFSWLENDGDFSTAARSLRAQGFGSVPTTVQVKKPRRRSESRSTVSEVDAAEAVPEGRDNCARSTALWAADRQHTFLWSEGKNWEEWRPCNYWVPVGDETLRSDIYHWLAETGTMISRERINNMTYLGAALLGSGNRPFPRDGFNPMRQHIPTANGMLDIRTRKLIEHRPENFNTYCLDFDYDREAGCPRYDQFMRESMRKEDGTVCEEWIEVLNAWIGYCLLPIATAETVLINVGEGGNGKSVWLKVLEGIVSSPACMSIDPKSFADKPEYHLAALFGKLVGFINEPNPKSLRDASGTLKAISSGDPVSARHPAKPAFSYRPYCRLVINCNSVPETEDLSHGFFRRLLLIEWRNRPEIPDPALAEKLLAERPGILNRALDALDRLRAAGFLFDEPEESRRLKAAYRRSQDIVQQWFEECARRALLGEWEVTDNLFRSFVGWCRDNECRPISKDGFGKRLGRMGFENRLERVDGKVWRVRGSIRLLPVETGDLPGS